jgi:site-specific recombinase XerD
MKNVKPGAGIELYLSDRAVIRRLRSGLLGRYLDSFASSLAEAGYARPTVQAKLRLLSKVDGWLRRTKRIAADLDVRAVDATLRTRRRRRRLQRGDRRTLRQLREHLQRQGVVPVPAVVVEKEQPLTELERRYESHLQRQRGLAAGTTKVYGWWAHRFLLQCFGTRPLVLTGLRPSDISSFVVKHAECGGRRRAQLMVTSLRSFFRFLVQEGETGTDLSVAVPRVSCRSQGAPIKYISDTEVEQILASCDRGSPAGRRDYAVLLLLARLGLRAGEVAGLELEDIDWRSGEIRVLGKGLLGDRLPLTRAVGEALAAYLRRGVVSTDSCPSQSAITERSTPW